MHYNNTLVGHSKKGSLQMYVQWQGMSVVEMWQADMKC